MADEEQSRAVVLLLGIKERLDRDFAYTYGHGWDSTSYGPNAEAGMVIWVTEGDGMRQYRIAVTDLGYQPPLPIDWKPR